MAQARVGRLATTAPDGRPHVVPFCFVLEGDTIYSAVDDKPKRTTDLQRLTNLRANPAAMVLVDHYEEDWSKVWWVRVKGTGRVVSDEGERHLALDALAAKYEQYRTNRPAGPVMAVDADSWQGWAAVVD